MTLPVVLFLGVLGLWILAPYGIRRLSERALDRRCRAARVLVLSYDDGPGQTLTGRLLDLLARHGAQATFFVLGRNIAASPGLPAALAAAGHEVGSHSAMHRNAWKSEPFGVWTDVRAGRDQLARAGIRTRLFRPPYGKLTLAGLLQGWVDGLVFGWWTVDSRDVWAPRAMDEVVEEVRARRGGVVLMHDYDSPGSPPEHGDYVIELTEKLLTMASEEGLRVRTLGQLLSKEAVRD